MNAEARTKYLEKLKENPPYTHKDIYYKGQKQKLPVYEIDLDYLVYNRWNGRIASLVKSHLSETGQEIDPTTNEGKELIEDFLWQSNKPANEATLKSIREHGQNEYGIVTKDGVVIDGNRRSMILRRVAREKKQSPAYFLGVILDEKLDDNPKEIMRLETRYQMGEDAKVDYNAIEKYLKCKDMKALGFSEAEIAKDMGETESQIKEYLAIMELMDEYLDELGYSGIYTRLDKTEDLFINLQKVLKKWSTSNGRVQWTFDGSDLSDYKIIAFDMIRYAYNSPKGIDAKDVREKLTRNSDDTFFAHESIWRDFSDRHRETVEPLTAKEKSIDELRSENPGRDLPSLLKSRDEAWAKAVDNQVKENFGLATSSLENLQSKNEPAKLLRGALLKLEAIDPTAKAFLEDRNVEELVKEINSITWEFKKLLKNNNHGPRN